MQQANLTQANIVDSKFISTSFIRANLNQTQLKSVAFDLAELLEVDWRFAQLNQVKILAKTDD